MTVSASVGAVSKLLVELLIYRRDLGLLSQLVLAVMQQACVLDHWEGPLLTLNHWLVDLERVEVSFGGLSLHRSSLFLALLVFMSFLGDLILAFLLRLLFYRLKFQGLESRRSDGGRLSHWRRRLELGLSLSLYALWGRVAEHTHSLWLA